MKKMMIILMALALVSPVKKAAAFEIREPLYACGAIATLAYFVFDQDTTTTGIACAGAAAAQPLIENHYKQKHGREHRAEVQELKNINKRYKNLSWVRGKRLNEPQFIIEEKKIPAKQTGTSIRESSVEYKFSLPDTTAGTIGD